MSTDTEQEAGKIVAWINANKAHLFALLGAGLAGLGYFLKLLTWEQAVGIASACGGFSWFTKKTDDQTKTITTATNVQTKQLTQAGEDHAEKVIAATEHQTGEIAKIADDQTKEINDVSVATTAALGMKLLPDQPAANVEDHIEKHVAKRTKKSK